MYWKDQAYDCGNSGSHHSDSCFFKELISLWNSILPESEQPRAQQSKLICLTASKRTKNTMSQWYMIVKIPRLVASCDRHKGKR